MEKKKNTKLLWKIHHWAGLYFGLIIGVSCLTGAVAVFIPEIDYLLQRNQFHSTSHKSNIPNFEKSLSKLRTMYPDMRQVEIRLPAFQSQALAINFVDGTDKKNRKPHTYFIDEGKDEILGRRNPQDNIANYLRQMHVRLYERTWGRQLVGFGGVAFLAITITGFLIYSDFMKKQSYPTIRRGKGIRILLGDWHKILGITALGFNFILALTGAWLGLQPILMKYLSIEVPNEFSAPKHINEQLDAKMSINWAGVFSASANEFPELIPKQIRLSDDGSSTIDIIGNIQGQIYERNSNILQLAKQNLVKTYKYDIREKPFSHKFFFVQEALHFGDFGGIAIKILYCIFGLIASFLSLSGFVVYFFRTEKKAHRKIAPMKIVFIFCSLIIFLLILLAILTLSLGYDSSATIGAILVNGSILCYISYILVNYLKMKRTY